jgi:hypothetical protein
MFLGEAASYGLIALGFIFISERNAPASFVLDVFTYIVGYLVLKKLLDAKSWSLVMAAALGGGSGTVVAIGASLLFT